jgi:hypothetical protein
MPSLAEMQRQFTDAILDGVTTDIAFAAGPVSPQDALAVHRNTVLGALVGALRLVYPSVDRLVGEVFFDQMAAEFALTRPPSGACLADYGAGFAEFLETYEPVAALGYLPDVARLELAIDRAASGAGDDTRRRFALDNNVWLELPQGLCLLSLACSADLIKDALDAGDDNALAAIDLGAGARWLVVWRKDRAAAVKPVGHASGRFLRALLDGAPAARALAAASADMPPQDAAREIQQDIFAASFCHVTTPA